MSAVVLRKLGIAVSAMLLMAQPLVAKFTPATPIQQQASTKNVQQLEIGAPIPEFQLKDFRGKKYSTDDFKSAKATIIIFFGLECPLAKLYAPRLNEIREQWESKGVQIIGINSNKQDSITEMSQFAKSTETEYPLLKDVGNAVADQFGAERTPEVYVFGADRKLAYRGRIDDQYTYGRQKFEVQNEYVVDAIKSCFKGQSPKTETTESVGCRIGRVFTEQTSNEVTYTKHISRILQDNCVSCHRPGEIAPFSLLDYDEVSGWAEMIREVTNERRMPPWHANPEHGTFANDARLSDTDLELINKWVENGAPEGDPADLPEPRTFTEGWQIGEPDVVIAMSKRPFKVPATGTVPYKHFSAKTNFKEDKWISAAEVRIGNRPVVHHVIVGMRTPGRGRKIHGEVTSEWIAATAPGSPPMVLPEGHAKRIPAGAELIFQMHYTPNGTAAEDITSVGFKFVDESKVKHQVGTQEVINTSFTIPPKADNHLVTARYRFSEDSYVLSMFPHMHLRGKAFSYEARYPDGEKEMLLDVPNYDFNWQNGYRFVTPKKMPAGTVVTCRARFDNSEKNIANPDPNDEVEWGDQTWEEMMIGYFDMTTVQERGSTSKRARTEAFLKLREAKGGDLITPELVASAKTALKNDETMKEFRQTLKKSFPQVDRICWTTLDGNELTIERCDQTAGLAKQLKVPRGSMKATGFKLKEIAQSNENETLSDLSKVNHGDMKFMNQAVQSSFHVPLIIKGKTGTINLWSTEPDAFPVQATEFLESLIEGAMK